MPYTVPVRHLVNNRYGTRALVIFVPPSTCASPSFRYNATKSHVAYVPGTQKMACARAWSLNQFNPITALLHTEQEPVRHSKA